MVRQQVALMLLLVSIFLLAIGIGLMVLSFLLLVLKVWLLFIVRLFEGHYIRASLWLFAALELTKLLISICLISCDLQLWPVGVV